MKREDVKIGQKWKRKDGRIVKTAEEREFRGSRELMLEPGSVAKRCLKSQYGTLAFR